MTHENLGEKIWDIWVRSIKMHLQELDASNLDNDETLELFTKGIGSVLEMEPKLPWVSESLANIPPDVMAVAKKSMDFTSPNDFILFSVDGHIIGRISEGFPEAAYMIAQSSQIFCQQSLASKKYINALQAIIGTAQSLFHEMEEDVANPALTDKERYQNQRNRYRRFAALFNHFVPISVVAEGNGTLICELFHPDHRAANKESGVLWGVWEVIDPAIGFHYWVSGYTVVTDGETAEGDLCAFPQTETESFCLTPDDEHKTLEEMRNLAGQMAMPFQLKNRIPIHPEYESWLDHGSIQEDQNIRLLH